MREKTKIAVVPREIRHRWKKRKLYDTVYDCEYCGQWTANMPLYRRYVCPKLDRRKGNSGRRSTDGR